MHGPEMIRRLNSPAETRKSARRATIMNAGAPHPKDAEKGRGLKPPRGGWLFSEGEEAMQHNTLETILEEILKHDDEHPDHGIGCACHDKHAGMIRRLFVKYGLNHPSRSKSLENLFVVLGYISRNR